MGLFFDSEIFMVYTRHTGELFCKNFMTIGCAWTAHLYFTNEAYTAGIKQWIVRDMPKFENLILKLRWMFWAII